MTEVAGLRFPDTLLYHAESMTWISHDESSGLVTLGLSALAVATAGEFQVFAARPLGAFIDVGRAVGNVETMKIVSSVRTPVAGRLVEANAVVEADGSLIGRDPYTAWLVRLAPADFERDRAALLTGQGAWAAIAAELERHR
jgi:glycine cleavage system H protein